MSQYHFATDFAETTLVGRAASPIEDFAFNFEIERPYLPFFWFVSVG